MNATSWEAVESYLDTTLLAADPVLDACRQSSQDAGLPDISVSPGQGKLLNLLAQMKGALRILEIGTLGGYSTIWLARALQPGGHLISLELLERHAEVARANVAKAGLEDVVEVRVGPALTSLTDLENEQGLLPFDFVFIDADKKNNAEYFASALRLTGPGSVIVVDNVVREGQVLESGSDDPDIVGTRRLIEAVGADPRVIATAFQTVGSKGYDGMLVAVVNNY